MLRVTTFAVELRFLRGESTYVAPADRATACADQPRARPTKREDEPSLAHKRSLLYTACSHISHSLFTQV